MSKKPPLKERLRAWAMSEHARTKRPELSRFYRVHFLKEHANSYDNMKRLVLHTFPDVFASRRIEKKDPRISGVGQKRAALRLGSLVDLHTGKMKYLAIKLFRVKDKRIEQQKRLGPEKGYPELSGISDPKLLNEHYFFYTASENSYGAEARTLEQVRELGIPVIERPRIIDVNLETKEHIMVVEDLTEGGKKEVRELFGIDPQIISNPTELKKEFEEYARILEREFKISASGAHDGAKSLREEVERSFFVVIDPKTRKGKLVFGDGDQIEPMTYAERKRW